MVIRELLKYAVSVLNENECDNAVFEAHRIVREVLNMSATDLVINHMSETADKDVIKTKELLKRRISGEPLQYILGTQEFMSLEFHVNKSVLIPRADTETLVEYVIEKNQNRGFTLLDIGTGTGCIPLSIAHYRQGCYARGLDISDGAIDIAHLNCVDLHLTERVAFQKCDIMTEIPQGKYDVITSNPPYIETDVIPSLQTEVKDFEPHTALDGGADGLNFYRRICGIAPRILNEHGLLAFEIGYNQAKAVKKLMSIDFEDIEIIKDLCGNDRIIAGYKKN